MPTALVCPRLVTCAVVIVTGAGCTGSITGNQSRDDASASVDAPVGLDDARVDGAAIIDAMVDARPDAEVDADLSAILFVQDFDDSPLGTYSTDQLDTDWMNPPWSNGVSDGRCSIIADGEEFSGRSLRVLYPEGSVGPGEGGAQWRLELGDSYDELYLSYRLKFASGYDFVRGGKLPGLAGGAANTGGDTPDGSDGWSARMMWRVDGAAVQYVYHPDQPGTYGEDFDWELGGARSFVPGQWHRVEHHVVMNTPAANDGLIEGWFDGVPALYRDGLRFRDVDTFAIELLYFSTFFGGSDATWAASKDEYVYYDDFVISTAPIGAP